MANKDGWPEHFDILKLPEIDLIKIGKGILHFFTERHTGGSDFLDNQLYDQLGETDEGV